MDELNVNAEECKVLYRSGSPTQTAIIYQGELDFISRCILDYPHIETGGQLFGFWTAAGVPVVLYAIGPGRNANHQVAFFNQDVGYLSAIGKVLVSRFGLQHIGEWHSHHQLGLAHPSGHDAATMVHGIKRQNLGRFLLCIGTCTEEVSVLNAFNFTQDSGFNFIHSFWDIKVGESPYRSVVDTDQELSQIVTIPQTTKACHGELKTIKANDGYTPPLYNESYWLKEKANNQELKRIVDMLSGVADEHSCRVQMDPQHIVHLSILKAGREIRVIFPQGFPMSPPLVTKDGADIATADNPWMFESEIATTFIEYFSKFQIIEKE